LSEQYAQPGVDDITSLSLTTFLCSTKRPIDKNGEPEMITVDKSGANWAALESHNAERSTPIKDR
jgi:hypothetical protein